MIDADRVPAAEAVDTPGPGNRERTTTSATSADVRRDCRENHVPTEGDDDTKVAELLGRRPQGDYEVVVRRTDGSPVVLRNEPLLHDGRPMPTRYWLVDRALNRSIGQLEATGAVDRAEAEVDRAALDAAHAAYAAERDAMIPADHTGPAPYGGVGGTRIGVKCLHAHYAYLLAGGDDPVGRWVDDRLRERGRHYDPAVPAVRRTT